jgi:hypothetical protein
VKDKLDQYTQSINPEVQSLSSRRLNGIQQLLSKNSGLHRERAMRAQLKLQKRQLGLKLKDILGVQVALQDLEIQLGTQAQEVLNAFSSIRLKEKYKSDALTRIFEVNPSHSPIPERFYAPKTSMDVKRGDLIQIDVVGAWAQNVPFAGQSLEKMWEDLLVQKDTN